MKKTDRVYPSSYVKASKYDTNVSTWYRVVRSDVDPLDFRDFELGIHCGSLEQAKEIASYYPKIPYSIYEIILAPSCVYSNPVTDFEKWSGSDAITDILNAFGISISQSEVIADRRDGVWDQDNAAQYIINKVHSRNAIVIYDNAIELPEQDIIILNPSSITSCTKL